MRKREWTFALAILIGCGGDDESSPPILTPPGGSIDAGTGAGAMDASMPTQAGDGAVLQPACGPVAVCSEGKPATLYNVCIDGAGGAAATTLTCLVDPNGTLYLAPLASGQVVMSQGWTQSTSGAGSTLSAADEARCAAARAAVSGDAGTKPPCTEP